MIDPVPCWPVDDDNHVTVWTGLGACLFSRIDDLTFRGIDGCLPVSRDMRWGNWPGADRKRLTRDINRVNVTDPRWQKS